MPIVVCLLWVVVGSWKVLPHVITRPTGLPHLESTSTSPDLQLFCKFQASVETDLKPPVPVGKEVTDGNRLERLHTWANYGKLMLFDGSVPRAKRTSASNPVKAAVLGNCFGSVCVLRTPSGCEKRRPACKMMRG